MSKRKAFGEIVSAQNEEMLRLLASHGGAVGLMSGKVTTIQENMVGLVNLITHLVQIVKSVDVRQGNLEAAWQNSVGEITRAVTTQTQAVTTQTHAVNSLHSRFNELAAKVAKKRRSK